MLFFVLLLGDEVDPKGDSQVFEDEDDDPENRYWGNA